MPVKNRVPALVADKFGGANKVNIQEIAYDMRLTYSTVERWVKDEVTRADFPILDKWCEYLGVEVGDILVRVPEEPKQRK